MANSRFYQFLYSKDAMLTRISGSFITAGDGSVASFSGKGIEGIHARPGNTPAGVYYVELLENYNQVVGFDFWVQQGTTGAPVTAGAFVTGTAYVINTVGTTDWGAIGYYTEDFSVVAGGVFIATGAGSGTGTATALASSGVANIELLPCQAMLQNHKQNEGSLLVINCFDYAGARVAPAAGSVTTVDMYLRNSTVAY